MLAVQSDKRAFGKHAFESSFFSWVLLRHFFKKIYEGLLAVGHMRIVLGVGFSNVQLNRLGWPYLVKHQIIKGNDSCLISLQRWRTRLN